MLLDDISDYLSTGGIGTEGTDLFKGLLPDAPDAAVALYETGGTAPVRAFRGAPGQPVAENAGLQVVCRAGQYDYSTARQKANDIYRLLEGMGDTTINGVRYLWIGARQSPAMFGRDQNGRPLISCNYDVVKELST